MSGGGLFGKLFAGQKPSALQLLQSAHWKCASCDVEHEGMFDIGALAPDHWCDAEQLEPNSALRLDGDFLSEDF